MVQEQKRLRYPTVNILLLFSSLGKASDANIANFVCCENPSSWTVSKNCVVYYFNICQPLYVSKVIYVPEPFKVKQ